MREIIQRFWRENLVITLLTIGAGLSTLIGSFVNAAILNAIIALDVSLFISNTIKLVSVYVVFLIFTYFRMKELEKTTQKMSNFLRFKIIGKISRMSPKEFRMNNVGHYSSWLSNDINQIEQLGFEKFYELMSSVVSLILSIVGLIYVHWSILIMTIIEVFIIMQLPKLFGQKIEQATENIALANDCSMARTTNLLSGFSTFYFFNNLYYLKEELKKEYLTLEKEKNKRAFVMAKVQIVGAAGNLVGQVSTFALSGFLAISGNISIGLVNTSASLSSQIFNTVGNLSYYLATIKSIEPLIEKINQFSKEELEESGELLSFEKLNKGFELQDIFFECEEGKPIMKDVNFKFERNKKYAIDGESGSGKSTILNMLTKDLTPTDGKIYIDGIDLNKIDSKELLSQVTYIEQTPFIFNGTIRENISLGDFFDDSLIISTLKYVGLEQLSDDLDTVISENGNNFSGGQRQRLALARGLVRQNNVILLDESTSSLDRTTAQAVETFILDIPNITVIMVSHHLTNEIKGKLDGILKLGFI